jgi:hypothetical protein
MSVRWEVATHSMTSSARASIVGGIGDREPETRPGSDDRLNGFGAAKGDPGAEEKQQLPRERTWSAHRLRRLEIKLGRATEADSAEMMAQ